MILLQQAGAAIILLLVTLSLQCGAPLPSSSGFEAFPERLSAHGSFTAPRSSSKPLWLSLFYTES